MRLAILSILLLVPVLALLLTACDPADPASDAPSDPTETLPMKPDDTPTDRPTTNGPDGDAGTAPAASSGEQPAATPAATKQALATLGAGCFWCVEAVFQRIPGVSKVVSGYTGGPEDRVPTYREVCAGTTGHAEVAQITYDPALVPFETLLEVFFKTHDPTTLNRQGADAGTQYRSAIFTHDKEQARIANEVKARLDASKAFGNPIVTEISPIGRFFAAEDYHQNYFNDNPTQGYCRAVVAPKVAKFEKVFKDLLAGKAKPAAAADAPETTAPAADAK